MAVTPEEFEAVRREFKADVELPGTGCWTDATAQEDQDCFAVVVTLSSDRSNTPAQETVTDIIESWRPELIMLVGVAGGMQLLAARSVW